MKHSTEYKCPLKKHSLNFPPKAAYISPAIHLLASIPSIPFQASPQAQATIKIGDNLDTSRNYWTAATKSSLWDCGVDDEYVEEDETDEELLY